VTAAGRPGGSARAFDVGVFVNCPFDDASRPLLHAALFAIHDCGFVARTALEASGSGETRLDKIVRIIGDARFSVHDISRVEVDAQHGLPRFNMPFECGLAFGAMRFGQGARHRGRDLLVLAAEAFQDQKTLSDLAGQDPAYHANQPQLVIKALRGFLAAKAQAVMPAGVLVRGHAAIARRYERFTADLPALASAAAITEEEIASFAYVPEWVALAARWQAASP
jgi:hypothetical protein